MVFIPSQQRPAFQPRPQSTAPKPQGTVSKSFDRRPQMVYTNEQIKAPTIIILDEQGVSV